MSNIVGIFYFKVTKNRIMLNLLLFFECLFFNITYNARVYEPLRCQCAYLSRYTKETKGTNTRKPAASNGLYTLLVTGDFVI